MPYQDNIHSAHGEINRLKNENDNLAEQNDALADKIRKGEEKKKLKCKTCGGWFARMTGMGVSLFWGALGIGLAAVAAWVIYSAVTEYGPSGNCYIEGDGLTFKLVRTVDWGHDQTIGTYRSIDEAMVDANKIRCHIK